MAPRYLAEETLLSAPRGWEPEQEEGFEGGNEDMTGEEEETGRPGLRAGALHSWAVSGILHGIMLFAAALLVWDYAARQEEEIAARMLPERVKPAPSRTAKFSDKQFEALEITENPIQLFEKQEIAEITETRNEKINANHPARGRQEAISNVPLGGIGVVGVLGLGGGGAGQWGWRDGGGRRSLVAAGGGSPGSEGAVAAALDWLARHQEPDGRWDCDKYGGSETRRKNVKEGFDEALTSMAMLAFLGAGHTDESPRYGTNVRQAAYWLESRQSAEGRFAANNYTHGLCTLAMCEYYGMTGKFKTCAQKAVNAMSAAQNKEHGGWDYTAVTPRGDSSITGWQVMAAKSARMADLKVDDRLFLLAEKYFTGAGALAGSDADPKIAYNTRNGKTLPDSAWNISALPIGMLSLMYMGKSSSNPWMMRASEKLGAARMDNIYFTYYAALAMFQVGGDKWKAFNDSMRDPLIALQCREGDDRGSWDPSQFHYGFVGGRVYSTAMAAMTLEVYYRYLPIYSDGGGSFTPPPAGNSGPEDPDE